MGDDANHLLMQAAAAVVQGGGAVAALALDSPANRRNTTGRRGRDVRAKRRRFRTDQALICIQRDYLGSETIPDEPLYGTQFKLFFRLSRPRFQRLMEDVMNAEIQFYRQPKNRLASNSHSLEAKLMLPLKTLAYGVASHCFIDYFQMSIEYARSCCFEFDKTIKALYMMEYLRLPTATDIKAITKLHKAVHKVPGMAGSLDCSHTYWKNCPKAWQGSYHNGKEKHPSIVLEAVSDYHMFFWHVSYGYTGNLNDKNILSLSPLLERMIDGSFEQIEREAQVVPFTIEGEEFNQTWITVDGIYPRWSRFVRGIKKPVSDLQRKYTKWQESTRKDIERAFGVLKGTFQFVARPIQLHDLTDISNRMICCLILHNIIVCDRVMGEVAVRYDPSNSVEEEVVEVQQPPDLQEVQGHPVAAVNGGIGIDGAPQDVVELLTDNERFRRLSNHGQHQRLATALMNRFLPRYD